jgi:tetratricopeptide (TPR) repeat protein
MDKKNFNKRITSFDSIVATTTASSDVIHSRHRIVDSLLIWLDVNINQLDKDCQNTLAQLRSFVNDVNIFTEPDKCIDFLTEIKDMKVFLIVTGTLAQQIIPLIHDVPQLDTIYIFCRNKSQHEKWSKNWAKINGVYTEIAPICESLQQTVVQCNRDSIALSFLPMGEEACSQNVNQLEGSFMYTQLFKEILVDMKHHSQAIKDFAVFCRKLHHGNASQLKIIHEFEDDYSPQLSIRWYTRECFTYPMLNRALCTLESETIINMGFFIHDLHRQLEQLQTEETHSYQGEAFIVYRGQGLSITDFQKLQKTKGRLMSFNNFLPTSKNREVSLKFAKHASRRNDTVGIFFQMTIDPMVSSASFAAIREVSYFKTEEEILFAMHTVFRIREITSMDKNNPLYQVELKLTADDDEQLRTLTERIREETECLTGWQRLGQLLLRLRQFDKAEELHKVLLEQISDEDEKAFYYNQLGCGNYDQGDYERAIGYFEKSLEKSTFVLRKST